MKFVVEEVALKEVFRQGSSYFALLIINSTTAPYSSLNAPSTVQ
jgi:hypothetical protein